MNFRLTILAIVSIVAFATSFRISAQAYQGEVAGYLTGSAHTYHGEFTGDLWGAGANISLMYAPLARLNLEARFGLGEIRWKVGENDLAAYPNYFGPNAQIGGTYPGSSVTIEPENESRLTTVDLLLNYVLVPDLPAIPFLTVGAGLANFSPSNSEEHEALPNKANEVYSGTAFSIPLGAGLRIPFSVESGMILRAEHRLVFSPYLDDISANGSNDAVTSVSLGLTYSFNPPELVEDWPEDLSEAVDVELFEWEHCYEDCDEECCDDYCHEWCDEHHCCCCCCHCCCGGGGGGGGAPSAPAAAEPAPEPPAPAEPLPEPPAEPAARKAFSKDIRFKLDTDEFDFTQPETQKNLDELLTYMKEAPEGHEVIIEGHASSEGPPQRNKVLSDLRAKKIKQWLEEQGVEKGKIRGTVGYGSSMPKVIEPSPAEANKMKKEELEGIRRQNRRIEVHVLKDAYES